jgi:hypothetical protein
MDAEETIDRLYGLPLAEFTRERNEAASALRSAGQREAAERVKALRKPTAVAAAVNRFVREHRSEVERFLRAAAVLREAQFSGKGGLATATKHEREELERLTGIGGEAVRQTLLAAAADEDAARRLLEGRLERELELGDFGALLAQARPAAARPRDSAAGRPKGSAAASPRGSAARQTERRQPEKKKPDDGAARARLKDARAALGAAEAEERRARGRWEQTQRELEKARSAVEKAQNELDRLHGG